MVGELLVWNDLAQEIMPFFKIRRYVTRARRRLGCDQDSPPSPQEHLMIVFHDLLLLDDTNCTDEAYEDRRVRLQKIVCPIPGWAEIGQQETVDFRHQYITATLGLHFASAISQNWEGLVLKGLRDPYLMKGGGIQRHIKLKKDYIPELGDSADLAVVGGWCDANAVPALGPGNWWWTNFFLACVENKDAVLTGNAKPMFRIVGEVSRPSISTADVSFLNQWGRLYYTSTTHHQSEMILTADASSWHSPTEIFTRPRVVEVVGAGFDRPSNSRYDNLRFPRVVKIHDDRTVGNAVSFPEYQLMAEVSRAACRQGMEDSSNLWLRELGFGHLANDSVVSTVLQTSQSTHPSDSRSVTVLASDQLCNLQAIDKSVRLLSKRVSNLSHPPQAASESLI